MIIGTRALILGRVDNELSHLVISRVYCMVTYTDVHVRVCIHGDKFVCFLEEMMSSRKESQTLSEAL